MGINKELSLFKKAKSFRLRDIFCRNIYKVGDHFLQMMIVPVPHIEFVETDKLSESSRMEGGYGSTGK